MINVIITSYSSRFSRRDTMFPVLSNGYEITHQIKGAGNHPRNDGGTKRPVTFHGHDVARSIVQVRKDPRYHEGEIRPANRRTQREAQRYRTGGLFRPILVDYKGLVYQHHVALTPPCDNSAIR